MISESTRCTVQQQR